MYNTEWVVDLLNKRNNQKKELESRLEEMPRFWRGLENAIKACVSSYTQGYGLTQVTVNVREDDILVRQTEPLAAEVTVERKGATIIAHYDAENSKKFEIKGSVALEPMVREILRPVLFPDEDGKGFYVGQV